MDRLHFCRLLLFASIPMLTGCELFGERPSEKTALQKEARFYQILEDSEVRCTLCFRRCVIKDGERGFCRNRENHNGTLYCLVYGLPSAVHVDPVEKLPLKHFRPGSMRLNIGTASCNLRCKNCHNWHLSQSSIEEVDDYQELPPEDVIQRALQRRVPSISFTYNEPTVFYEYMYDIARLARAEGLEVLLNTNGTMQPEPLSELLNYISAVNIDLKGFSEDFYRKVAQGSLEPVLGSIRRVKEKGVWLELVNLVIPTINDDPEMIREMCRWIRGELGPEVPLHFSRFVPAYRLTDLLPTPVETLEKAHAIAREEGLMFVTVGNVPGHKYNSTFCPECGKTLVDRTHFSVHEVNIVEGRCRFCRTYVPGVWD